MKNKIKNIFLIISFILLFSSCQVLVNKELTDEEYFLTLVNRDNKVPRNINHEFTVLWNDEKVDSRMYPYLQEMFDDMRKDGLDPVVSWGYRTNETQKRLFDDKVSRLISEGYSKDEATKITQKSIAVPGTSEHELGLAVDINSKDNKNQKVYDWLKDNSYRYGFILRYPSDKTDTTKIIFEPWHYRYVGKKHATYMYNNNLVLEEYIQMLNK